MRLPLFQVEDQAAALMQDRWSAILNPIIASPGNQATIISNYKIVSGINNINHLLGRKLQGYRIILKSANANIHDNQLTNQTPQLTLILVSDAPTTVSIEVF